MRFTAQYPNSALRKDAEARIAALETAAKAAAESSADSRELAHSLQLELKRVGCFDGAVNGEFDDATKAAWHNFVKHASLQMPDDVSSDAIKAVRGIKQRVCPLVCPRGEHVEGESCVGNSSAPPSALRHRRQSAPRGRLRPPVGPRLFAPPMFFQKGIQNAPVIFKALVALACWAHECSNTAQPLRPHLVPATVHASGPELISGHQILPGGGAVHSIISRHRLVAMLYPLHLQERTSLSTGLMSTLSQKRSLSPQRRVIMAIELASRFG